jgi:GntR family transcriptional regulator
MNSELDSRPTTAHALIEHHLRDLIAGSAPGDRLPGDRELSVQFGVSRMTVRQAVGTLVVEGRIHRVPGSGSYVAERPVPRRASRLLSFSEHMRRQGRKASAVVLASSSRPGTPQENKDLQQNSDARVHLLRRVLLGDGVPIALEDVLLCEACGPALEHDLGKGSLHRALAEIGREPQSARGTMSAESARTEHAKLLDVAIGAALMVQRQVIVDAAQRPVELALCRFVGDRIVFHVDQEKHNYADPSDHDRQPDYVVRSLADSESPFGS